jgi:hypothetical protein
MRRAFAAAFSAALLFISAHRLPAPIVEEPTSTPQPERSAPRKQKSVEVSQSNSASRFDGIWQGARAGKSPGVNYIEKFTLTVRGKSAELTGALTSTLSNPRGWSDLPEQYRRLSPLHIKVTNHADHVVADGSDLIIRWRGGQLVDWEPKTLPREYAEKLAAPQTSNKLPNVFTLNGDELVAAGGTIYHRVK